MLVPILTIFEPYFMKNWSRRWVLLVKSTLEEPENHGNLENHDIGESRYPLKVIAAVRLWYGMLSTNMEPNRRGLTFVIESRLGDLACLEISGLLKIDQNQLFWVVLEHFPNFSDAPAALIVAESQKSTHRDPRSYTYFEIVSGPGPSRQLLGGNGAIYWLIPNLGPPSSRIPQ